MIYDLDEYFQEGTGPKCFQCTITTYLSIKLLNTINKRVISGFFICNIVIHRKGAKMYFLLFNIFIFNAESVLHF